MSLEEGADCPDKRLQLAGELLPCPRALRILAVDHSPERLSVVEPLLLRHGHRVIIAADGQQAIAQFKRHEPDAVLLDSKLPGLDPFEATRQIKALTADRRWVPVIMLTAGGDDPAALERGHQAGVDDYLVTPFDPRQLTAKMTLVERLLALQLHQLELKRFRSLVDHLPEGIVATDARGTVVVFNPAAERLFGHPAHEVIGRNVSLLMPIPDAHRHDAYVARYRSTGESTVMGRGRDIFARRKDGSLVPISVHLSEMEWDGGRHFIGVVADASARGRRGPPPEARAHARADRDLLDRVLRQRELQDPLLHWHLARSESLGGDALAARRAPDGRLLLLLADAAGHGVGAAIGLAALAGIFYAMAAKGFGVSAIVAEMNRRLHELLPPGMALAATVVAVDEGRRVLEVWNGGMPDPLLCLSDGTLLPVKSPHPPLGTEPAEHFDASCRQLQWARSGHLVACSDGLVAALAPDDEPLGMQGLCSAAARAGDQNPLPALLQQLEHRLAGNLPRDDISIAVIRLH